MFISITSQKGGVGKTTVATNLAQSFSEVGNTLLIDGDPQGSLGHMLASHGQEELIPRGMYDLLTEENLSLKNLIYSTHNPQFSLLFSGGLDAYDSLEITDPEIFREGFLVLLTEARRFGFQFILVDTPAGLFRPTRSMVEATELSILVQQPEPLSTYSTPQAIKVYEKIINHQKRLKSMRILFSMVKGDALNSSSTIKNMRDKYPPSLFFQTYVPEDEIFNRASEIGSPVCYLPDSREQAGIFSSIRDEILHPRNS